MFFSIGMLLAACNPAEPVPAMQDRIEPTPTAGSIRTRTVTVEISPSPTITNEISATPKEVVERYPSEQSSTEPAPTLESFQLCSPLAWETIPELFEIISDPYSPPPPNRAEERHHGVDFSHYSRKGYTTIEGEPVQVILDGRVSAIVKDRLPYGNMVIIETPLDQVPIELVQAIDAEGYPSLYVLYAHMTSAPALTLGEKVVCGQQIGEVGRTGYNVVNPHLHLETRLGVSGSVFLSMAFYTAAASSEEMEAYTRWRTGGEFIHFDPMLLFQAYLDWLSLHP